MVTFLSYGRDYREGLSNTCSLGQGDPRSPSEACIRLFGIRGSSHSWNQSKRLCDTCTIPSGGISGGRGSRRYKAIVEPD